MLFFLLFIFGYIVIPDIPVDAQWEQQGVTIAGDHGHGSDTNQFALAHGLFVFDDGRTILVGDMENRRIVQWNVGDTKGQIVAGGQGLGNGLGQLHLPTDVLVDEQTKSLIICDHGNRRILRWSRLHGTNKGEVLIDKIDCFGLAIDDHGCLYVSDIVKHEVRRYQMDDKVGTVVAGGHGQGDALNQFNWPSFIFVDRQQTIYVSDMMNHRVMKWAKDAMEGIVVAGGQGPGNALTQLYGPAGLFIDSLGTLYVADSLNNRVVRWIKGAKQGTVIVGGNGEGQEKNQFHGLRGLSFDGQGNLYVIDWINERVQRFSTKNSR